MHIFGKTLASLGIGSARVDTRLEKSSFRQGETLRGEVFIQGGQSEQVIDEIYLFLVVQYDVDGNRGKHVLNEYRLSEQFTILPRETRVIPFEFVLAYDTPMSTPVTPIYLKTGLDIKMAKDPGDYDGLEVSPHPYTDIILQSMEELGFQLNNIQLDFDHYFSRFPFIQKFHMLPSGVYEKLVDEIHLIIYVSESEVDLVMEVDRKANDLMSSMEEALQLDKKIAYFTLTKEDLAKEGLVDSKLQYYISRQLE